jgi:hypothetical protein
MQTLIPSARLAGGLVAALIVAHPLDASAACTRTAFSDFERRLAEAQNAFQHREPGPLKALWSHAADASLFGGAGGHEVGWAAISPRLDWVSAATASGDHHDEVLTRTIGADLAIVVQLEHIDDPKAGQPLADVNHLRVTHVIRCEGGAWRLLHRHADPLLETRRPPSAERR